MWPITEKERREWRTGLHAANPQQAQALVAEIDRLKKELEDEKRSHKDTEEHLKMGAEELRRLKEPKNGG